MKSRDMFPLGQAEGMSFCNRTHETKLLCNNIETCRHTLVIAPRRYGKSSLIHHVVAKCKLPFTEIDFFMAGDERVIERYLLDGVSQLVQAAIGSIEHMLQSVKHYLKHLRVGFDLEVKLVRLQLDAKEHSDPATNIKEALQLLEHLLAKKKQRAVLVLDEFQNIGAVAEGVGIEAAIRHVAQKTKYLAIVFSGSHRRLLEVMFADSTRPLYKLCWQLGLDRIAREHYVKHIQKAAKQTWKTELSDEVLQTIFQCSELHPYYVNRLCDYVWSYFYDEKPPSAKQIHHSWQAILQQEKSDAVNEISKLALGQKKVLQAVARQSEVALTSRASITELSMSGSSITTAANVLEIGRAHV